MRTYDPVSYHVYLFRCADRDPLPRTTAVMADDDRYCYR